MWIFSGVITKLDYFGGHSYAFIVFFFLRSRYRLGIVFEGC